MTAKKNHISGQSLQIMYNVTSTTAPGLHYLISLEINSFIFIAVSLMIPLNVAFARFDIYCMTRAIAAGAKLRRKVTFNLRPEGGDGITVAPEIFMIMPKTVCVRPT